MSGHILFNFFLTFQNDVVVAWNRPMNDIDWFKWKVMEHFWILTARDSVSHTGLNIKQWCVKFPTIWYSSPPPFLSNLDFPPQNFRLLPLFPIDIHPNSLNIIGKIILLPLSLYSCLYSSPQSWYSLLSNFIHPI